MSANVLLLCQMCVAPGMLCVLCHLLHMLSHRLARGRAVMALDRLVDATMPTLTVLGSAGHAENHQARGLKIIRDRLQEQGEQLIT